MNDVRYGLRQLWRNPGFTLVAVITLALGIGANTAIFSMLEGVVLSPLPYTEPERLVMMLEANLALKHSVSVSYLDFRDWQRNARAFEQLTAVGFRAYNMTSPGAPEHLDGREVTSGFFSNLGATFALGHDFSTQEDLHGGAPVVIISHRLWRNRFGGSRDALGKQVTLDGVDHTIVGVLPSGFRFPGDSDLYTPLGQGDPLLLNDRTVHTGIFCVARLKPGVTIAQAQEEMTAVQTYLDQTYPGADQGLGTEMTPLQQAIVGDTGKTLFLLLGAVGLVLLIACANVADLLLARSAARIGDFALRLALGANRAQIMRQLITESVLLALAGGCLGLVVARWEMSLALAAVPGSLPRSENIGVNIPVLLFTFGIAVVVGILFGLAPALKTSNADLQTSLKDGGRGSANGRHRVQPVLVIVQVALTLVVLAGASLLFRTIHNLWGVNPGFNTQHLLTFKVGLSPLVTQTASTARIAYQQLLERVRQIPGVQAADLTTLVPLSQDDNAGPFWFGSEESTSMAAPRALYQETAPDYLRVMGIPLLQGRFFNADDTIRSAPVVVIDSVLAHTYFPDRDPVGQPITIAHWGVGRIVGVVGHVSHYGLGERNSYTQNQIYIPFYQLSDAWVPVFQSTVTVIVRTPIATATIMPSIKHAVYGTGSEQPVYDIQSMEQIVSTSMMTQRFPMILLGAFAALALLLASVGIYGVISYLMTQRVHEIGIRMALGAEKQDVLRMIVGQGLRLALVGVAIGGAAVLLLAPLLSSFSHLLYGVRANDPLTFVAVSFVLLGAALLACYFPARRAANVDPIVALRHD